VQRLDENGQIVQIESINYLDKRYPIIENPKKKELRIRCKAVMGSDWSKRYAQCGREAAMLEANVHRAKIMKTIFK